MASRIGVNWDLRRDDPYSVYHKFEWTLRSAQAKTGPVGSCWDRHIVRMKEMEQSVRIIEQALAQIRTAMFNRQFRNASGQIPVKCMRARNPPRRLGFYIVSDGTGTPYRIKARGPGFVNLSVINEIARGGMIADSLQLSAASTSFSEK